MDAREEAFEALEAVQRDCMVFVADHCEAQGDEPLVDCTCGCDGLLSADEHLWQRALTHALGSKDWWSAHYREATSDDGGPPPVCSEVIRRTLGAYAAVSFTAVDEMHRQQVEWRLFGEVTRPKAPSPEWAALAAIGQEVRSAVREVRCPDDTEAFNARSVVSFYVLSTRDATPDADDAAAEKRLRRRDFVDFSLPPRLGERPVDRVPLSAAGAVARLDAPADDCATARFAVSRWMRARRKPRLRGA